MGSEHTGSISSTLHRSLDGTKVVNSTQWRSQEEFEACLNHPDARLHKQANAQFAEQPRATPLDRLVWSEALDKLGEDEPAYG